MSDLLGYNAAHEIPVDGHVREQTAAFNELDLGRSATPVLDHQASTHPLNPHATHVTRTDDLRSSEPSRPPSSNSLRNTYQVHGAAHPHNLPGQALHTGALPASSSFTQSFVIPGASAHIPPAHSDSKVNQPVNVPPEWSALQKREQREQEEIAMLNQPPLQAQSESHTASVTSSSSKSLVPSAFTKWPFDTRYAMLRQYLTAQEDAIKKSAGAKKSYDSAEKALAGVRYKSDLARRRATVSTAGAKLGECKTAETLAKQRFEEAKELHAEVVERESFKRQEASKAAAEQRRPDAWTRTPSAKASQPSNPAGSTGSIPPGQRKAASSAQKSAAKPGKAIVDYLSGNSTAYSKR